MIISMLHFLYKIVPKSSKYQLMAERLTTPGSTGAIDCYTCTSMGGSDRKCEDPVYKEFLNVTPNCQVTNFFKIERIIFDTK